MEENGVAKVIRIIGWIFIIGGVISSLILGGIFTIYETRWSRSEIRKI